jgi:hypothetical protein
MTDFENAVKKVTDVLHAAARRSGEIFENTKISYTISMEKEKIARLQGKIGEKFYKIFKDGGAVPDQIVDDLEAIAAIEEVIRALEKTISDSKPFKFCSECGTRLEIADVYCAKCGAKQHETQPQKEKDCETDEDKEDCCGDADDCCDDKDDCCDEQSDCCDDKGDCCDDKAE